jgi:hypothetical protein
MVVRLSACCRALTAVWSTGTRLTNGFSKKAENHLHATALYLMHYNFCRVHQTLTKRAKGVYRTPAMAAGLTHRVWTVTDLLLLRPRERNRVAASAA